MSQKASCEFQRFYLNTRDKAKFNILRTASKKLGGTRFSDGPGGYSFQNSPRDGPSPEAGFQDAERLDLKSSHHRTPNVYKVR